MINTNITIKLYSLNELSEQAKQKAIEQHRNFELSIMQPSDFISGDPVYDTQEEIEKAYNSQYDYFAENDEPIIENIEANNYLFFENGELASVVQYCGGHPRAGETDFTYMGTVYKIA